MDKNYFEQKEIYQPLRRENILEQKEIYQPLRREDMMQSDIDINSQFGYDVEQPVHRRR